MLAPEEMTAEGGIDLTLLVLDDEHLAEKYREEHKKLEVNNIMYEQGVQFPVMELMARMIAIEKVLIDAEITTQEELNRYIVAFKVSHMRHLLAELLPQIRSAQARSKIVMPDANGKLPGLGG